MQSRDVLKRHATLVDRMAGALGVDLEERVLQGDLPVGEISDAVLRCTSCTAPGACAHWLDEQADARAAETPGYCRNRDLLMALRPGPMAAE